MIRVHRFYPRKALSERQYRALLAAYVALACQARDEARHGYGVMARATAAAARGLLTAFAKPGRRVVMEG